MATLTEASPTQRSAQRVRRRRIKAAPYLFVAPFILVFAAATQRALNVSTAPQR